MRRCELFSKLTGVDVACMHPEEDECGFQFYTNGEGKTLGMCRYRKDKLGFKKCWAEIRILNEWLQLHKE